MIAPDGKMRLTDVADTEVLLRIIQSIPSKKAEAVKLWFAKVGYERIEEINNPEKVFNRGRDYWQRMAEAQNGFSKK